MSKISLGTKLALVTIGFSLPFMGAIIFLVLHSNRIGAFVTLWIWIGFALCWIWFIDKRWPKNPNETRSEGPE